MISNSKLDRQQFPLDIRSMAALQRADLSDRDEFGALAPDEERHERDASVMQPESGRQRELLAQRRDLWNQINTMKQFNHP